MGFEFIADRPALDFVATVAERGSADEEKLQTTTDLIDWARQSGVVDDLTTATPNDLEHARDVRDVIFGLIAAMINDTQPERADTTTVNRAASRPRPVLRIDNDGQIRRTGGLDALLAELATDCLDLFASGDRASLHWCADRACTRPFIDRSRGQRRRWCGMKGCGDRAKAAAYRHRQRQAARS